MDKILPVRELFKVSPLEAVEGLRKDLNIKFEDNVIIPMSYKEAILLRFILDIYNSIPKIPIVSKHSYTNFYSNGILTAKTINKSFEVILKDVVDIYCKKKNDRKILEPLYKAMYRINNDIYNILIYNNLNYVNSINISDFLDIQMDKELLESMKKVAKLKNVDSVNNTYKVLDNILRNKPEIKENIITKGYISGTINANQVKQLLASRGYVTELDKHIFKTPIASSFTLGMTNIYDIAIESRAGAKALFLSTTAVQESEYFARELQLNTMIAERLVDTDCGSKDYLSWLVRTKDLADKPDLPNLLGKYYLNEETNKLEAITKDHKHLEGKTIKLRSVLHCKLKDPTKICTKCFGDLAYTVPLHSNIGHFSSTEVTQKITQNILSTKHLATSAVSGDIKLDHNGKILFNVKRSELYFRSNVISKTNKATLVIDQFSGFGIKDLNPTVDVYKLNPTRVSRIQDLTVFTYDKNGKPKSGLYTVLKDGKRYGHFTYDFLKYIIDHPPKLTDNDLFSIDLTDWNPKNPVITMPELEYDYISLLKSIKSAFRGTDDIKYPNKPEAFIQLIFDLINNKLDVNLALLEVMVYAMTVRDINKYDYRLGRNVQDRVLMKSKQLPIARSLGAGYDWEGVIPAILSPKTYYGMNGISHPMDVMVDPQYAINEYNRKHTKS